MNPYLYGCNEPTRLTVGAVYPINQLPAYSGTIPVNYSELIAALEARVAALEKRLEEKQTK